VVVGVCVQNVKAIQKEEETAMAELFEEPRQKAAELVGEAVKEWSGLSQELLADVPTTMEERCAGTFLPLPLSSRCCVLCATCVYNHGGALFSYLLRHNGT